MTITKDSLNKRLEDLKKDQQTFSDQLVFHQKQVEQHINQLNAISGAIQDAEYWLAQLDAPEV